MYICAYIKFSVGFHFCIESCFFCESHFLWIFLLILMYVYTCILVYCTLRTYVSTYIKSILPVDTISYRLPLSVFTLPVWWPLDMCFYFVSFSMALCVSCHSAVFIGFLMG